jgi:hypothetical protein
MHPDKNRKSLQCHQAPCMEKLSSISQCDHDRGESRAGGDSSSTNMEATPHCWWALERGSSHKPIPRRHSKDTGSFMAHIMLACPHAFVPASRIFQDSLSTLCAPNQGCCKIRSGLLFVQLQAAGTANLRDVIKPPYYAGYNAAIMSQIPVSHSLIARFICQKSHFPPISTHESEGGVFVHTNRMGEQVISLA